MCVLPHFPAFPHSFKFLPPPGLRGHSLLTSTLTLDYFPFPTHPNNPFLSNPCLWVFSWLPCWINGKMWLRIWPTFPQARLPEINCSVALLVIKFFPVEVSSFQFCFLGTYSISVPCRAMQRPNSSSWTAFQLFEHNARVSALYIDVDYVPRAAHTQGTAVRLQV